MYKLVALLAFVAAVSAAPGNLLAYSSPVVHAPVVHAAPIVHAPVVHAAPVVAVKAHVPVATSYANTYKVSVKAPVVHAAPVVTAVHAAPIVHAAPVVHAPIAYAAAPVVKSYGLIH